MAQKTDPVCGKKFDDAKAVGHSEFHGETYFFCSAKCKKAFDDEPEAYMMHAMGGGLGGEGPQ